MDIAALRHAITLYLREDSPWPSDMRSFGKMLNAAAAFADETGIERDALADRLTGFTLERRGHAPFSVHMLTQGGTGSHWLGDLLQDAAAAIYVGEVYFHADVMALADALGADEADRFFDAVELLHMFLRERASAPLARIPTAPLINSAHGLQSFDLFQRYRRDSRAFELIRDPRDRTLSVTYRKPGFRAEQAPDASDEDYLRAKARATRNHTAKLGRRDDTPALVVRFETIVAATDQSIRELCGALGMGCEESDLDAAVARHAPNNARIETPTSRLNPAGTSRHWYADASTEDLRLIHGETADAIVALGYPLCDCQGRKLVSAAEHRAIDVEIEARWRDLVSISGFGGDGYWRDLDRSGVVRGEGRLRLRPSPEIAAMGEPPAWLSSVTDLCAAGLKAAILAPLLLPLSAVETADLRRLSGLASIVGILPGQFRTILLAQSVPARLVDRIRSRCPEALIAFD